MDGDRKKRKAAEGDRHEEEEDEDAKMEEFFALIQSTRDIRERLIRSEAVSQQESYKPNEREPKAWTPRFEPEDFVDAGNPSGSMPPPPPPPPPVNNEAMPSREDSREDTEEGEHEDGNGLDLKLSL